VKFYIGVTDNSWFKFLSALKPDELNFWQPGGSSAFRALSPGEPFLFKLHSPLNFIVGGGFFVRHSIIPLTLAWEAFEQKNGASDYISFRSAILQYRARIGKSVPDPLIGCIILTQPFFLERAEWIPVPADWKPNIVQGKTYDTSESVGASLWSTLESRLSRLEPKLDDVDAVAEDIERYGREYLIHARLGQGAFRISVTEAYKRRCAITGERTLPVLESAHIKPYAQSGPHRISNGLLLRSDLHKLFDLGYVTITPDYHVEISKLIKEEYENGRDYYALHGKNLSSLPDSIIERPSTDFIQWHNDNVYVS
jgi:putative restriction endonuclease